MSDAGGMNKIKHLLYSDSLCPRAFLTSSVKEQKNTNKQLWPTLYNADVEADPTAYATPIIESPWKPSAYAIITIPVIAIIAATICTDKAKQCKAQRNFITRKEIITAWGFNECH